MATARSIRRIRTKKRSFLPESWQAFLARRLLDLYALAIGCAGLILLLSLISYDSRDPSWNSAGAGPYTHNWMNAPGAFLSDILLQTLGIGSFVFVFALFAWSARAYRRESIRPVTLRIIALLAASVFFAIAFAGTPSFGWLVHPTLGSASGALILGKLLSLTSAYVPFVGPVALMLLSALFGIFCFIFAAAITRDEIHIAFEYAREYTAAFFNMLYRGSASFLDWVRYHNDPELREELAARRPRTRTRREPVFEEEDEDEDQEEDEDEGDNDESIPVVKAARSRTKKTPAKQQSLALRQGDWELPGIDLLATKKVEVKTDSLNEDALRKNAELLQNVLGDFNIEGEIVSIHPGPVVTLYELEPAPGVKTSRVISLSDDIARSMSAVSVRCAVVPGRNVIGIELPNKTRQTVYMEELVSSTLFEDTTAKLPLVLGKDIGGQPILADLARMPHLLVAGTTGSGKSVAVNTMIMSLLFALPPEKCRFIMIDPKMLELSVYDDIPHLLAPVVTEPGKAVVALKWTVREMEDRYRAMSKLGVRNIEGYNERIAEAKKKSETIMRKVQTGFDDAGRPVFEDQPLDLVELPYIVVIVDEFADLMLVAGKDVENAIQRLAQMARAAGIHLIMATQRPSVDVITGVIKANFPTRISFQVTSKIDSRTILGEGGAEQLLGMGDMLYMAPGGRITRVHGPFVSDMDVENVVDFLKEQGAPAYIDNLTDDDGFDGSEVMNAMFGGSGGDDKVDELYDQAVALVAREGKASTSFIQRYLQIGYNRAARIIEEMERQGVVTRANATGKRDVLIKDVGDY